MSVNPTTPSEFIAGVFHATYETLAPEHGYKTREASAVAWEDVPPDNKALMIATVQNLLDTGVIAAGPLARHVVANAARLASLPAELEEVRLRDGNHLWSWSDGQTQQPPAADRG